MMMSDFVVLFLLICINIICVNLKLYQNIIILKCIFYKMSKLKIIFLIKLKLKQEKN